MLNPPDLLLLLKGLELTDSQRTILTAGLCPMCERPIRGKFEPVPKGAHFMAPEIYETLREKGINTSTGHKNSCGLQKLRIP